MFCFCHQNSLITATAAVSGINPENSGAALPFGHFPHEPGLTAFLASCSSSKNAVSNSSERTDVSFPIVAVCIDHAGYTTSGVGLTGISQDHPCFDRLSAMISQYFFTALSPYSGDAIRDRRFRQATRPAAPSASQPREFWSGDCSLLDVCPALIGSPTVGTSGSLPEKTIAL